MKRTDLDSHSTLSDNYTRLRLAGASVMSEEVSDELVAVTRKDGFSLEEIEDGKKIQANLSKNTDPESEAFFGILERITEGHRDELYQNSMIGLSERRRNQLPSLGWVDNYTPSPDLIERYQSKVLDLQKNLSTNPNMENRKGRVFHQKQTLGFAAKLTVKADLPSHARIGPFTTPGDYKAVVRFSNGQGVPFRDKNPDVRAISIKSFPNKRETDLLMTSGPGLLARDIEEFIRLAEVMVAEQVTGEGLRSLIDTGEETIKQRLVDNQIHPYEASRMAQLITGRVVPVPPSPAGLQFWSSIVRAGDFVFKPTLVPSANNGTSELTGDPDDPDCIRNDLLSRIQKGGLNYTLRLLFFTDDYVTPINDATSAWDASPCQVDVADLEIVETSSTTGPTEEQIQQMPFNPNNGFDGVAITKARDEIYYAGARGRDAALLAQYQSFFDK